MVAWPSFRRQILGIFGPVVVVAISYCPATAATRILAIGGSCGNHGSIGSSFVSCTDSKNAGCTAAKPCCTFQDASNAATADGDVIEVHHGNYNDGSGFVDNTGSYAFLNARYAARLNTAGVTLRSAAGDTPTLDLGMANHMGILVAKSRITVEGLWIVGGSGGSDTQRASHIHVSGGSDATIRGNTLEVGTANHVGTTSGNMCVKIDNASRFLIENNTCRGGWDFSFWVYSVGDAGGGVIRGNVQSADGRGGSGSQRGIIVEMVGSRGDGGNLLIYNNTLEQSPTSGTTYGMYLREIHWNVYVFNNIFRGVNSAGIYFQDDLCSGSPKQFHVERWNIFNNTFVGTGGGGSTGIRWPGCVEASVRNNIFYGFGSGAELRGDCPTQICPTRDDNARSTANAHFTHNLCFGHSSCVRLISGNSITQSELVTDSDPRLDGSGRIGPASVAAIDRANSDPLGQGPGNCSVTSGAVTADCGRDIDGTRRGLGAGWDLGANETTTGPVARPGRVETIRREDARTPR